MQTIDVLQARFDYWLKVERVAFERRTAVLGRCTARYAAIYAGHSQQNPSVEEMDDFDHANAERLAAKAAINGVISELRAL